MSHNAENDAPGLCLCLFEDGVIVRTDDGCPYHSNRPGVRLSDSCECGHAADVHDQYGCVTCWNEMGDPCDIPPATTGESA